MEETTQYDQANEEKNDQPTSGEQVNEQSQDIGSQDQDQGSQGDDSQGQGDSGDETDAK